MITYKIIISTMTISFYNTNLTLPDKAISLFLAYWFG